MDHRKIGTFIILACFVLALMPATVVAANDNIPVPLIAVNLFQDKPKSQWNAWDFVLAGRAASSQGNYQEAIDNFNYAELKLITEDKLRTWNTEHLLSEIEKDKSGTYSRMPGHQVEADAANQKSQSLEQSSEIKKADEEKKNQCLIATATFDSPLAPQVQQLREFREGTIYSTESGTQFMTAFNAWYYSFSPAVANFIDDHPSTKPPMRILLTPLLGILNLSRISFFTLALYPDISVIVVGLIASTLIGIVYAFPLLFVLLAVIRRAYLFTFTTGVFKTMGFFTVTGLALLVAGGMVAAKPALLAGSVLFIVSLVLLPGLFLSWICLNWLDSRSANANNE